MLNLYFKNADFNCLVHGHYVLLGSERRKKKVMFIKGSITLRFCLLFISNSNNQDLLVFL